MSWTWESLTNGDKGTLKEVFESGSAPDVDQLLGHTYDGLNRGLVTRLTGQRFKKVFYLEDGEPFGHNVVTRRGRPVELGWFRLYPEGRALRIDYDVEQNSGSELALRLIQDLVVLPNPGDHDLVLGKAHLRKLPVAYFVLKRGSTGG